MSAQHWTFEWTLTEKGEVAVRADRLCRAAEPHTDEVPCPRHIQEALRQVTTPTS